MNSKEFNSLDKISNIYLIKDKLNEILELCELTEEKYQIKPKGFLVDNYLRILDDIDQLIEELLEND